MVRKIPHTYDEARALADEKRAKAYHIADRVQFPKTEALWRQAVADNQWYISYATMYGIGEILTELRELNTLLRKLMGVE